MSVAGGGAPERSFQDLLKAVNRRQAKESLLTEDALVQSIRSLSGTEAVWAALEQMCGGVTPRRAEIWTWVARHSPVFDHAMLRRIAQDEQTDQTVLLQNPAVTPALVEEMLGYLLDHWTAASLNSQHRMTRWVRDRLVAFREKGHLSGTSPLVSKLVHFTLVGRPGDGRAAQAWEVLGTMEDLPETVLMEVATSAEGNENLMRSLARHPAATPRIWRGLLRGGWDEQMISQIAEMEPARRDPWIRDLLRSFARFRSPAVFIGLAREAGPEEFASLVREAARVGLDTAVEMLENAAAAQAAALTAEDLLPLLTSGRPKIREAAIRHSARLAYRPTRNP